MSLLPKPRYGLLTVGMQGGSVPYLECMVSYGRISSRVWEAVAGFGNKAIDVDKVAFLDFQLQKWRQSIPEDLRLSITQITSKDNVQPRSLQRLQVLLYLRANHMQILVHRHNVLSPRGVLENRTGAHLVTDIAKDTIRLLVRLRESSTLYETQQSVFNYFLISALSAVFLAVCHAPAEFSNLCRDEFFNALSLLKDLSSRSSSAKRLWKSLRGLKNVAPQLGLTPSDEYQTLSALPLDTSANSRGSVIPINHTHHPQATPSLLSRNNDTSGRPWLANHVANVNSVPDTNFSMPDMFQISCDLTDMFEAFGGDVQDQRHMGRNIQDKPFRVRDTREFSTIFGDLM